MLIEQSERLMTDNARLREELNSTHFRLREANNQIAHLEFELESLKQDAGADIHNLIVSYKAKLAAAEALAVALDEVDRFTTAHLNNPSAISAKDEFRNIITVLRQTAREALRQYREAGK